MGTPQLLAAYSLAGIGTFPALQNPGVAQPLPRALFLLIPQTQTAQYRGESGRLKQEICISLVVWHGIWQELKTNTSSINSFQQLTPNCYASQDLVFESSYK